MRRVCPSLANVIWSVSLRLNAHLRNVHRHYNFDKSVPIIDHVTMFKTFVKVGLINKVNANFV